MNEIVMLSITKERYEQLFADSDALKAQLEHEKNHCESVAKKYIEDRDRWRTLALKVRNLLKHATIAADITAERYYIDEALSLFPPDEKEAKNA